jgi:U2 small nuclear ribonucleoprotein B''
MPSTGATNVEVTELQQSIFNAPAPGNASASAPSGLPAKPPPALDRAKDPGSPGSRGTKRPRDEKDESEESDDDVAMEEDSEED